MSRLDDLIAQYCPDGVEYKKLADIATISRGGNFQKKDFTEDGIPCIHYGQIYTSYSLFPEKTISFISSDIASRQKFAEPNDIVMAVTSENIEDVCKCVTWMGKEKVAVSGHTAIIHHSIDSKFLNYYFHSEHFFRQKVKLAHGTKVIEVTPDKLSDISVPVPPLPVQQEIVRILDLFTTFGSQLQYESTLRKQQYQQYMSVLFSRVTSNHKCTLDELCDIQKGNTPIQKATPGNYPMVVTTLERKTSDKYQFDSASVCIPLVSSRGHGVASLNHVYYQSGKFALGNILCAVTPHNPDSLNAKYLYYYLEYAKDFLLVPLMKGGANVALRTDDIKKVKIPVPPIDIQEKIVQSLEIFDEYCINDNSALTQEISLRQKQYEYYRDKLLTFKEKSHE